MKKFVAVLIGVLVLVGCSNIQFQGSDSVALQVVAQRIGYYVAKNNPQIVAPAKLAAKGLLTSQDSNIIKSSLNSAATELAKQFPKDPLLESDLKLIIASLKIKEPDTKLDLDKVAPLVEAFINGLEIGAK